MNLCLDARTATDHFPGIGRYVVNLAQGLMQIAPDLSLSLLYDPSAPTTRLALPNLPRAVCPASPFSLRQQWVVPGQLRRLGATLYHSPYYLMPYRPGIPTVLTCYDLIPLVYPQYFSPIQRLVYRLAHALALRTAHAILAISQVTKADLICSFRVAPQKIVVTPLAADAHFAPQPSAAIAALRQKYPLPDHYVLYFGINKPHKNLVRLIDAFAQSGIRNPKSEIRLVIAGAWDPRYPQVKTRAAELGLQDSVIFLGPVPDEDLPGLYRGAMLFVFPSLYEGFGLPVLEAMACGTPVACSNTSSLPEIVGDAALTFDPTDVEDMAQAMARVLVDKGLRQTLRQRGLTRARQFTWQRTAQQTLEVYRDLSGS